MVQCSRWEELCQSLRLMAEMSHVAAAPTQFRFLNRTHHFDVGFSPQDNSVLHTFHEQLALSPSGNTPLCTHITNVIRQIQVREHQLRDANQMACLIIATDGLPTDGNIVDIMSPLKNLPVWVVLRLCTSDDRVVEYWNSVDKELELNMEVLDDFAGEAREIHKVNPWLTYGEPLHRMREFGVHTKEIDLLDELPFQMEQVRTLSAFM
jgi:hypothetical protein